MTEHTNEVFYVGEFGYVRCGEAPKKGYYVHAPGFNEGDAILVLDAKKHNELAAEVERLRETLKRMREYLKCIDAYVVQMDREANRATEGSGE